MAGTNFRRAGKMATKTFVPKHRGPNEGCDALPDGTPFYTTLGSTHLANKKRLMFTVLGKDGRPLSPMELSKVLAVSANRGGIPNFYGRCVRVMCMDEMDYKTQPMFPLFPTKDPVVWKCLPDFTAWTVSMWLHPAQVEFTYKLGWTTHYVPPLDLERMNWSLEDTLLDEISGHCTDDQRPAALATLAMVRRSVANMRRLPFYTKESHHDGHPRVNDEVAVDTLPHLLASADQSKRDAVALLEYLKKLTPSQVFKALSQFTLLEETWTLVARSGYFTLPEIIHGLTLPGNQYTPEFLEEPLLRMILQLSARHVGPIGGLNDFHDLEPLVRHVLKSGSAPVIGKLRYYARLIMYARATAVSTLPGESLGQILTLINRIVDHNSGSIAGLVALVAPGAVRRGHVTDTSIAEFVLRASQTSYHHPIIGMNGLVTATKPVTLLKVLEENIRRAEASQAELEAMQLKLSASDASDAKVTLTVFKKGGRLCTNHLHTGETQSAFMRYLWTVLHGPDPIPELKALKTSIDAESFAARDALPGYDPTRVFTNFGQRKFRRVVCAILCHSPRYGKDVPQTAVVLAALGFTPEMLRPETGAKYLPFLKDLGLDVDAGSAALADHAACTLPIATVMVEYVPTQSALARAAASVAKMNAALATVPVECHICYEVGPTGDMRWQHADHRHGPDGAICQDCLKSVLATSGVCSLCRGRIDRDPRDARHQ